MPPRVCGKSCKVTFADTKNVHVHAASQHVLLAPRESVNYSWILSGLNKQQMMGEEQVQLINIPSLPQLSLSVQFGQITKKL